MSAERPYVILKFSKFKNFASNSVFGEPTQIQWNFKTSKSEAWEQRRVWFLDYFNFEMNYDVLKSRSPRFLLKKKYTI